MFILRCKKSVIRLYFYIIVYGYTRCQSTFHNGGNRGIYMKKRPFCGGSLLLQVEPGGFEPPSIQVTDMLSTCLSCGWLSEQLWTQAPKVALSG